MPTRKVKPIGIWNRIATEKATTMTAMEIGKPMETETLKKETETGMLIMKPMPIGIWNRIATEKATTMMETET